jgi:tRNA 2-thiouridine synthesizing protein A
LGKRCTSISKEAMAMVEVDVRGFGCPIPVVRIKKVIDQNPNEEIMVLVESAVSKENVSRLAESKKYLVQIEETAEDEYKMLLTPSEG